LRTIRTIAVLAATAALLATTGDRLLPPRVLTPPAAAEHAIEGAPGFPEFALFGWVSPPASLADSARYAEMAAAGLNLVLPALDDTGGLADVGPQLDLAQRNGLRVIAWDERFQRIIEPGIDADSMIQAIVATHRDHPALAGYYLGDEPAPSLFPLLANVHARLRELDPAHPGWNNLFGLQAFDEVTPFLEYTRDYADTVKPAILCNAQYDFLRTGDRLQFIENVSRLNALARGYGIPFWTIVQLVEHHIFRGLEAGELRWQVSHLLAYGARGIGYFTYWTPPPSTFWNWQPAVITVDGARTPWFDVLAAFNPRVRAAGEALARAAWITTQHAGGTPPGGQGFVPDDWVAAVEGRAAIGQFSDPGGARYVLVANSDSLAPRTIALVLPGAEPVTRLGAGAGAWMPVAGAAAPGGVRVEVDLDAGDFALLRLGGAGNGNAASGSNPGLDLAPNPARDTCRFSIAAAVGGATLEIIDAHGRRVWARALPPGRSTVQWNGVTDRGARAAGGMYFARVRDDRGTAVRRFAWLGTR
jgi:hypothetical protein